MTQACAAMISQRCPNRSGKPTYITVSVAAQMNQITGPHDAIIHRPIAAKGNLPTATCLGLLRLGFCLLRGFKPGFRRCVVRLSRQHGLESLYRLAETA